MQRGVYRLCLKQAVMHVFEYASRLDTVAYKRYVRRWLQRRCSSCCLAIGAEGQGDAESATFAVAQAERTANRRGQLLSDGQAQAGATGAAIA